MKNDICPALADIHDFNTPRALQQTVEIQDFAISREEAQLWAKQLHFLDISGVAIGDEVLSSKERRRAGEYKDLVYDFDNFGERLFFTMVGAKSRTLKEPNLDSKLDRYLSFSQDADDYHMGIHDLLTTNTLKSFKKA